MTDAIAFASAFIALASLAFSIYTYRTARRYSERLERPLLALVSGEPEVGEDGNIGYKLTIQNMGQHPASQIRFRTRSAPEANPGGLQFWAPWDVAHDYQPGGQMDLMRWPPAGRLNATTLVQVECKYADAYSKKEFEPENYWLVVFPGPKGSVTSMNQQQRNQASVTWGAKWAAD